MTTEQRDNFNLCTSFERCSATVCPLDADIAWTHFISGDKHCARLVDYLEGKELPEALRAAIIESETKWRKILSEALLDRWVKSRNQGREYFSKVV